MSTTSTGEAHGIAALCQDAAQPVTSIRVLYPDLHGVARGKDVPIGQFDKVMEHGLCFCSAIMGTDLLHTPVVGGEAGYPDLLVHADLDTIVIHPWEPGVASCLSHIESANPDVRVCDPRGAVERAAEQIRALGFEALVGPELEFFLVVRDPTAPNGFRRHVDNLSMVYTVGPLADPEGRVRHMTEQLEEIGLDVFAVNHEYMNSQYEINLRHSGAVSAADRAFRLKTAVKDMAAQNGLHATFMGKPFNDQGGSGTHLHLSLNRDGRNMFANPGREHGVSVELEQFTAGLLEHTPALMALLNPTINAYRRIQPDSLAPTHANWGYDNRASCVRIPPERGGATRVELRVGDGAANPYLGIAAVLLAGADGIRRRLKPPAPVSGDAYRADAAVIGAPLPQTLDQALDALRADTLLREGLGEEIVETFLAIKDFEVARHRAWVSDWDIREYLHHL